MTRPALIFIDGNTLWHRRVAQALSCVSDVATILPWAITGLGPLPDALDPPSLRVVPCQLPPGWASRTAVIGQRLLARAVHRLASTMARPAIVVLTSPKYRPLAAFLSGRYPLIYYCADDYRGYTGWGGAETMRRAEHEIVSRCDLSIFASLALRERAISEYGLAADRAFTSPNATEPRFLGSAPQAEDLPGHSLVRPVVGILGGFSDRIDRALVEEVAAHRGIGTFLVGGAVPPGDPLLRNRKVLVTGQIPHATMHLVARSIDLALIPYRASTFNHLCSPMRLYDHLASGAPVFSTPACDQVIRMAAQTDRLQVVPTDQLPARIAAAIDAGWRRTVPAGDGLLWADRADALTRIVDGRWS